MQRTITLHLPADQRLIDTNETVNAATNDILVVGFDARVFNKLRLHHLTYYPVRERYPGIPSSLVTTARDNTSEMLKREKLKRLPSKRRWTAIRYNLRTFTPELGKGYVTLASMSGRVKLPITIPKYFSRYLGWTACSAKLSFDGHRLVLGIVMEERTPSIRAPNTVIGLDAGIMIDNSSIRAPNTVIGLDAGIINHAVLSNNKFLRSSHIRSVKSGYQHLRDELQAKGTRSARRKLKHLGGREKRFMANVNHQIANIIVRQEFDVIALERLDIRREKSLGATFNQALGNWSFGQLQRFIEYKAEALGKIVIYVDARYTSQKCSRCGSIDKRSRNGLQYKCTACGFELNADLNAARNIAFLGISEVGRLFVNEPNVASSCFHYETPQLQAHERSRGWLTISPK